jgi:predicted RNase H-like nuclease (RuvC/YqgF family)
MNQYTDEELNQMCLDAENVELKRRLEILEKENAKFKAELEQLSTQMEGMIYED